MTVTYRQNCVGVRVPVLHRVHYRLFQPRETLSTYDYALRQHQLHEWLEINCQHRYYRSPPWQDVKFVEFEDDQEATIFALRWS